jgi:quercetin dioxygenase-like cupin family protein
MTIKEIFDEFAKTFEKKIGADYHIRLQYEFYDLENEIWQIEVKNGKVFVYDEKKIDPEDVFILSRETLEKLYNNELSPLSAHLETPEKLRKGELAALITWKDRNDGSGKYLPENLTDHKRNFLYRYDKFREFFSKDYPSKIIMEDKNCIKHNGDIDTIGLQTFSNGGQIFVSVKKGETLQYPSFEKLNVYIISGKGKMIVGDVECEIKAKEYLYINHNEPVQIKNAGDEALEGIVVLHLIN